VVFTQGEAVFCDDVKPLAAKKRGSDQLIPHGRRMAYPPPNCPASSSEKMRGLGPYLVIPEGKAPAVHKADGWEEKRLLARPLPSFRSFVKIYHHMEVDKGGGGCYQNQGKGCWLAPW